LQTRGKKMTFSYNNIGRTLIVISTILSVSLVSWLLANMDAGTSIKPKLTKNTPENPLPRIILLTTTKSCQCTLKRCGAGEKVIREILKKYSGQIVFEKIDYAENEELVTTINSSYKISGLPALLFFDTRKKFAGHLQLFFNKEAILKNLEKIGIKK